MKLNIEELTKAANDAATKAVNTPNTLHDGFDGERLKAFARLIVERCALEAEAQRGTVSMFVSSRDCQNHSDGVKECAAAIRNLLGDK